MLQLLTEYVQIVFDKTENAAKDNPNITPSKSNGNTSQKRYALFKDGVRLEEDKLMAELLDPQALWTKVMCVFKEIGIARQHSTPRKPSRPPMPEDDSFERDNGESEDCHLLVLYRKQQAFRNFHFDPSITVGQAIKTITEAFNIPATTINPDDWSFRTSRTNSLNKLSTDGYANGDGATTPLTGSAEGLPTVSSGTPTGNNLPSTSSSADTDSAGSSENDDTQPAGANVAANTISPKPSFPFSLLTGTKNAFMFELAPVNPPTLSLSGSAPSEPTSGTTSAVPMSSSAPVSPQITPSPSVNTVGISRKLKREASIMTGEPDNSRHECIFTHSIR